uniref:ERVV2 protein n=1 Tax=Oryzias latipes TaxID=8090 RepID=A0A3B3HN74_ORYLA
FMSYLVPIYTLVRDLIEINRYALQKLLSTTYTFSNASAAEMSAIRTMVLQNRLVLDLLTASSGGVCKMVGDTCCTFIPDSGSDGQDISTALHDLTGLQSWKPVYITVHTDDHITIFDRKTPNLST